jgi:hypothetical protein
LQILIILVVIGIPAYLIYRRKRKWKLDIWHLWFLGYFVPSFYPNCTKNFWLITSLK